MKKWLVAAMCVALVGCASTGVKVRPEQMATLKKGETTREQVVATFGQPTSIVTHSDGKAILVYSHADAKFKASTFIPIVGLFAGGMDVTGSVVHMTFDAQGKLVDYTSSQSVNNTGYGLTSGTTP